MQKGRTRPEKCRKMLEHGRKKGKQGVGKGVPRRSEKGRKRSEKVGKGQKMPGKGLKRSEKVGKGRKMPGTGRKISENARILHGFQYWDVVRT